MAARIGDGHRLSLDLIYCFVARQFRCETGKRGLYAIGIGNTATGKVDQLPVTAKAYQQVSKATAQRITKRSLFVTCELDTRWIVGSFHQRQFAWLRADQSLPLNYKSAQRFARLFFSQRGLRTHLREINRCAQVCRQPLDRAGVWLQVSFCLAR